MKKFSFPLNTVLNYKNQVLDNLMSEQAQILKDIADTQIRIEGLQQQSHGCASEFDEKRRTGMAINQVAIYEKYLYTLRKKIELEQEYYQQLLVKKEKKRQEVVEARTETASIEKLKEKKLMQYEQEVQKDQERFIEEFVSNVRAKVKSG